MAKKEYQNIWESSFFDLRSWGSGLCHTYNPPEISHQGSDNRMFFMLGNEKNDRKGLIGFDIYFHEKGQFWPRSGLKKIGQPEKMNLKLDQELDVGFTQLRKSNLNLKERKCNKDTRHSVTDCIKMYLKRKTNCNVDWFNDEHEDKCSAVNLEEYVNMLIRFKTIPFDKLSEESGCYQKCKIIEYKYEIKRKESIDWDTNYTSSFYLEPASLSYVTSEEYFSYDEGELVGDVGGSLGLFLGWSLLSLIEAAPIFIHKCLSRLKTNCGES